MLPWETCTKMTGDGTHMILSKVVTGLEIKTLFITCADKLHKLFYNSNLTECLSQEPNKEKSIKELSVVSQETKENNRHTELAPSLIELDMLCCILFSEDHWPTTAHSSFNISPST